jgi:hypothetical protein
MAEWSEDHVVAIDSLNLTLEFLVEFVKPETGWGP